MEILNKSNFNSQFSKLSQLGYSSQTHNHKTGNLIDNILRDLNQTSNNKERGIRIIVKGETTQEYLTAVASVLRQKDWDVAFLSDINADPKDVLGLILNKGIRITTLDPMILTENYNVIRVNPPVVVSAKNTEEIISAPSIKPILVFIGVFAIIVLAAWAAWRISQ